MKRFALFCVVCLAPVAAAQADDFDSVKQVQPPVRERARNESLGETSPTPEMWFYEQERRRLEDPQNIVRAAAQQKAAERQHRLAAMAWFGYSNARPSASPDTLNGNYSPRWISNGYMPGQWVGAGSPTIILQADRGSSHY
jgi:hypothetical protein